MRALITGANGFIGKNLCTWLIESGYKVHRFVRETDETLLDEMLSDTDVVFHLAGVNRPPSESDFERDNHKLTQKLCDKVLVEKYRSGRNIPIIFTSSISAVDETPYGKSKRSAESVLADFAQTSGAKVRVLRLPNIFGKGCRPNYNSVVSTFCSNAISGLELYVSNPEKTLRLLYIDDLMAQMVQIFETCVDEPNPYETVELSGIYEESLEKLATTILKFDSDRRAGIVGRVGVGFERKLYATYISHLPTENFVIPLNAKVDKRGSFAEFVKTNDSGQFSVLKCAPGEVRGRHYHNTKSEQFLVIRGVMKVTFENIYSYEKIEHELSGDKYEIAWAIPGWSHSFENIGAEEALVVVWANEIFDLDMPDTYSFPKGVIKDA